MYRFRDQGRTPCAGTEKEQTNALDRFFDSSPFKSEEQWLGAVHKFESTDDFNRQLKAHLNQILATLKPGGDESFEDWFQRQAVLLKDLAGPRYTPFAHVETDIGSTFDWLMARQTIIEQLDQALAEVWKWVGHNDTFESVHEELLDIAASFREDRYWHRTPDFGRIERVLTEIEIMAWAAYEREREAKEKADSKTKDNHNAYPFQRVATETNDAVGLLKKYARFTEKRILLLTGEAGQGKTHTLVHEVNRTVENGGIAVGVLGQGLRDSGSLWESITTRLEWRDTYTALLDRMESEAVAHRQRALLVFDALNETPDRQRWRQELLAMLREIMQRPHLCVALSVRTDYRKQVLPSLPEGEKFPWIEYEHPGLQGVGHEDLVAYFDTFGVKAPVAPPIGGLNNPLYIQLLAKSLQGRELRHWQVSWLEVWKEWMEHLQRQAREKIALDDASRPDSLRRTMRKLAQGMLEEGALALSLPRIRAEQIARQTTHSSEAIGFLCSAGALYDYIDADDEERIAFGFERLSDTFLADALLNHLFKGLGTADDRRTALAEALAEGGSLRTLADPEDYDHPLYARRSGLLTALCLAVPPWIADELPRLMPDPQGIHDWQLGEAFIDSLYWRSDSQAFGVDPETLHVLSKTMWKQDSVENQLDGLIRLSLIPEHPFGMERLLHPFLMSQKSLGARDAAWSIHLVPLWLDEESELHQVVVWACDAQLQGAQAAIALPIAQLLAWCCASSQNALRENATKGMTRLMAACPEVLEEMLADFLDIDDPYVLEAVLIAIWGVMLSSAETVHKEAVAKQIQTRLFRDSMAGRCHITIRYYARKIIETAVEQGHLPPSVLVANRRGGVCQLPLDEVPDKPILETLDRSLGFRRICSSSTGNDFYRYVIGGNSLSIDFSSTPLPKSEEPVRPFTRSEVVSGFPRTDPELFDLALAGRFVAWNCLRLGWTAERFDSFDTGGYTNQYGRYSDTGSTERIGKKYQWISWHTLLAYLSDHYVMTGKWEKKERTYQSPDQVDVDIIDPSRWLKLGSTHRRKNKKDDFWTLPTLPIWPEPTREGLQAWIQSEVHDLSPTDVVSQLTDFSMQGEKEWFRVAAEHTWKGTFAPGLWGLNQGLYADLWWQMWPILIANTDLPHFLDMLQTGQAQTILEGASGIDHNPEWSRSLSDWPELLADWDTELDSDTYGWGPFGKFPVPCRTLVSECGHPDHKDEHAPVLLPTPSIFREWGLRLDLQHGLVLHGNEPVFGLMNGTALLARMAPLQVLLRKSGHALVWWCRGERRAFLKLDSGDFGNDNRAWADYFAVLYLAGGGRIQTAWLSKRLV